VAKDGTINWEKLLSDIEKKIEEFRRRKGRDPKSLQVIAKSDDATSTVNRAAELLTDSDPSLTRAQAVSQIYEARPDLYETEPWPTGIAKADQFESERRDMFVNVERLADDLQLRNRSLTRAQAVAKALAIQPDIYDRSVLMASDKVPVQQESAR